jgi:hypothetical protein
MPSIIGGLVIAIGVGTAGAWVVAFARGNQEQAPVPIVAQWPFDLERKVGFEGTVRLTLRVERGVVEGAGITDGAVPELARAGLEAVSTWRFSPVVSTTLATTFSHKLDGTMGCGGDPNQTIRAQLPSFIEVVSRKSVTVCHTQPTEKWHAPVSRLTGRVICACASKAPVEGARLRVFERESDQTRARSRAIRDVLTDADGQFRVLGLRPGVYRIEIDEDHFNRMHYWVGIDPSSNPDLVEIALERPLVLPPPTHVIGGAIPTYPVGAPSSGVQGEVNLRVSMQGDEILDIDADAASDVLADAAVSNVRAWKFRSTSVPVLSIRFRYVIDPGDCPLAVSPLVTMQLPDAVTVRATRVPCAPTR